MLPIRQNITMKTWATEINLNKGNWVIQANFVVHITQVDCKIARCCLIVTFLNFFFDNRLVIFE